MQTPSRESVATTRDLNLRHLGWGQVEDTKTAKPLDSPLLDLLPSLQHRPAIPNKLNCNAQNEPEILKNEP